MYSRRKGGLQNARRRSASSGNSRSLSSRSLSVKRKAGSSASSFRRLSRSTSIRRKRRSNESGSSRSSRKKKLSSAHIRRRRSPKQSLDDPKIKSLKHKKSTSSPGSSLDRSFLQHARHRNRTSENIKQDRGDGSIQGRSLSSRSTSRSSTTSALRQGRRRLDSGPVADSRREKRFREHHHIDHYKPLPRYSRREGFVNGSNRFSGGKPVSTTRMGRENILNESRIGESRSRTRYHRSVAGDHPCHKSSTSGAMKYDYRGLPGNAFLGYPKPSLRRVTESIDRKTVCPFLLRIFYNMYQHHSLEDFNKYLLLQPSLSKAETPNGVEQPEGQEEKLIKFLSSELQLYTWKDASLREVVDLVKDVCPEARIRGSKLSLKLLHLDDRGKFVQFELGNLHNTRPGKDDKRTLIKSKFEIGDVISIAVVPGVLKKPPMKSDNGSSFSVISSPDASKDHQQEKNGPVGCESQQESAEQNFEDNNIDEGTRTNVENADPDNVPPPTLMNDEMHEHSKRDESNVGLCEGDRYDDERTLTVINDSGATTVTAE